MHLISCQSIKLNKLLNSLPFFIIPFLGGNHLSLYYITIDKFWIETSFILTLLLAVCVNSLKKREVPSGFIKFMFFFMPFLLANIASLFYTWNMFNTLCELNVLVWVAGCVYLYAVSENKDSLLKALIFGTVISVLCMVVQYEVMFPNLMEVFKDSKYSAVIKGKVVPFSSFLNEATLGGYFLFLIPLSIYFGVVQKRLFYMIMSSVIIFGLLFSLSRMGMFIGALSIIACFVMILVKRGMRSALFLVATGMFALLILLSVVYSGNKGSSSDYQDRAIYRVKETPAHIKTLTYRTVTWKIGVNAFLDKPLSGYGAGTFEHAYKKFYEATLYTKYAHNVFIKVMVELGLTGLACFLFYFYGFIIGIKRFFIRSARDDDSKNIFIALSVISGFLFAVSNVTFEMPAYTITFFILSSVFFAEKKGTENTDNAEPKNRAFVVIIFLSVVVALIGSFFFTTKANISEKMNEEGTVFTENGLLGQAFTSYDEAINAMPLNDYGYIGIVTVLMKSYAIEQNVDERMKIRDMIIKYLPEIEQNHDRHAESYFLIGSIYSLIGNTEKAEDYLNKAIQYHPSSGFYMYETANYYFKNGNLSKTKALIKQMEAYADRHAGSQMHGLYVYKMRDLKSNIEYMTGNIQNAVELARINLEDAEKDMSTTENVLTREYVLKEPFIRHLRDRVVFYESKIQKKK